jgi:hypothetical protein
MKTFKEDRDHYLTVDFEIPDADWSLLVIDDMWARPKVMIFGALDSFGKGVAGIGEGCIDYDTVKRYADERGVSSDTFDNMLLFLPWMVYGTNGYGSVTICDFPDGADRLRHLFESVERLNSSSAPRARKWVIMIDVQDRRRGTGVESVRFEATWDMLDEIGHPAFARAMLTRGGVQLPPWTTKVYKILKESTGDEREHQALVQDWLLKVQGEINPSTFQDVTEKVCHNPSDLEKATFDQRESICNKLARPDLYGVWRWVRASAGGRQLGADAAHRWLAAKAFQKTFRDEEEVPVTALVAICEGANFLYEGMEHRHKPHYEVTSGLLGVPESKIDRLAALGEFSLSRDSGGYQAFAQALRHWLTLTEQFEEGKARIHAVAVGPDADGVHLRLSFTFTGELPAQVFRPQLGESVGRAARAWLQLRKFAAADEVHSIPTVSLLFDYRLMVG